MRWLLGAAAGWRVQSGCGLVGLRLLLERVGRDRRPARISGKATVRRNKVTALGGRRARPVKYHKAKEEKGRVRNGDVKRGSRQGYRQGTVGPLWHTTSAHVRPLQGATFCSTLAIRRRGEKPYRVRRPPGATALHSGRSARRAPPAPPRPGGRRPGLRTRAREPRPHSTEVSQLSQVRMLSIKRNMVCRAPHRFT